MLASPDYAFLFKDRAPVRMRALVYAVEFVVAEDEYERGCDGYA